MHSGGIRSSTGTEPLLLLPVCSKSSAAAAPAAAATAEREVRERRNVFEGESAFAACALSLSLSPSPFSLVLFLQRGKKSLVALHSAFGGAAAAVAASPFLKVRSMYLDNDQSPQSPLNFWIEVD